jgi:hypothetical protein
MKIFVVGYQELQEGKSKRVEPTWSQAAKLTDQDPKHTFQAAEKDLCAEGIDDAAIQRHYGLIEEWLQTVVLAPTNDPDIDESKSEFGSTLTAEDEVADSITAENSALGSKKSLPTGPRESSKSREQGSKSHEQPHEEGSSTLFEGGNVSGASVRDNMPVVRSDSLSIRRSQSSQWEPPDVDDVTDYAAKMLAKVLRSKYSPQDGEAASRFHKLDNRLQLGPFHQLDRLLEDAALVPFGCFPDISSNPVDLIRGFHQLSWLSLPRMLKYQLSLSY